MSKLSLLIVGSNNKPTGGIPRYIPNQIDHLPSSVTATVYDIGAPGGSGAAWFLKSLILALFDAIKFPFRRRPDVAHIHTSHAFSFFRSSFYVLFVSYVWRRPVVYHIHGSSFDEFMKTDSLILRKYQSVVFNATDEVIVLGDYWYEEMSQHIASDKLTIIKNAITPGKYEPKYNTDPFTIVFISDLVRRKGVLEIVEAINSMQDSTLPDFTVELGGKGELSNKFHSIADRHDNVTYHGYVSEEKKRELLNEGNIYILPSYAEGLPIAMLEAMAGGNAIISTTVGSIPEVITDNHGILIEAGDTGALKNAMVSMLENRRTTREMARKNRQTVSKSYSWKVVMEQLVHCYEGLGNRKSES